MAARKQRKTEKDQGQDTYPSKAGPGDLLHPTQPHFPPLPIMPSNYYSTSGLIN
jgi:hypothetical protein